MIEFNEEKHEYTVNGEKKPSVTTILHYITADGYSTVNPMILEQAKVRGTMVHEITAQIDFEIEAEEMPSEIVMYAVAYQKFLDDYMPLWEGVELPFYVDEDGGYCGTIDRYGYINGELAVLDIKTTASPNKEQMISVCCQTAAYGQAVQGVKRHYSLYLKNTGEYKLVDLDEYAEKYDFNALALFRECHNFYNKIQEVKQNGRRKKK